MTRRISFILALLAFSSFVFAQELVRHQYWLDNKFEERVESVSSDSILSIDIDISNLSEGIHFVNFRAQNSAVYELDATEVSSWVASKDWANPPRQRVNDGVWGGVKRKMFYKSAPFAHDSTAVLRSYEYWLDDKYEKRTSAQSSAEEIALSIDIDGISEGIHFINFRAQDTNGTWGGVKRKMFYKSAPFAHDSTAVLRSYEYWLDDKYEKRVSAQSSAEEIALSIDIDGISEGIHFINFRAQDTNGTWGGVKRKMFYKSAPFAHDSTAVLRSYEYWLDDKYEKRTSAQSSAEEIALSIDIDGISEGIHFINFRAQDTNGTWGGVKRKMFYKSAPFAHDSTAVLRSYEYWLDDKYEKRVSAQSSAEEIALSIDIDGISEGIHFINFRAQDTNGTWGGVKRKMFYKSAPFAHDSTAVLRSYEYWLDDKYEKRTSAQSSSEEIALSIDIDGISEGIHFINFRAQDTNGTWGGVKRKMFYKSAPFAHDSTAVLRSYEYWLDDKYEKRVSAQSSAEEIALSIDIDGISEGIHFINFRAQDTNGTWGGVKRKMFYKSTAKNGEPKQCEYWIDEDYKQWATEEYTDSVMALKIDITRLPLGTHTLYFRVQGADGIWSLPQTSEFSKDNLSDTCKVVTFDYDNARVLRMNTETPAASIYYRLENVEHFTLYQDSLVLSDNRAVYAFAAAEFYANSDTTMFVPSNFYCEPVQIAFAEPLLTINCEAEDATIHYIIDREEAEYTEPIEIMEPCTVYAYATKPYFNNSDTLSYNVLRCAEPVISYTGGNVRISCATEGARIYYTIDGTVPDSTALRYTEPFTVSNNMTVKAVAYLDGALHSAVSDYIVDIFRVSAPTFVFVEPLLTINCETEGATIHYIINEEEAEYTEPIEITEPCTVYAYATKENFNSSDTVSYTVEIKNMEFSSNGLSYNILSFDDYTCEVAKSRDAEYQGNINIPQTAERYGKSWNVVAIADEAFKDCHKVTSIIIPNSIAIVGKSSLETGNRNMLLYCTSQTLPLMPKDFGNIIIDGVANFIQLADSPSDETSPTHDFSCPEPFTARKISYEHSYTQHTGIGFSEGWETIALPFDVQTVYHVTAQETIAPFKAGGTQRKFWLYELTDAGFVEAEAIKAYTPYIISMPNNEEYVSSYNLPGVVSFRAVNALVAPSASSAVSHGNKILVATMHGVDAADNVYAINSYQATDNYREGSYFIANLRNVRPFEAYITSEQSLGAKAFSLKELASEMTGIEDVTTPSVDIPACYNLSGQKVGAEYKGIVIRNGKKTLIK